MQSVAKKPRACSTAPKAGGSGRFDPRSGRCHGREGTASSNGTAWQMASRVLLGPWDKNGRGGCSDGQPLCHGLPPRSPLSSRQPGQVLPCFPPPCPFSLPRTGPALFCVGPPEKGFLLAGDWPLGLPWEWGRGSDCRGLLTAVFSHPERKHHGAAAEGRLCPLR